MNKKTSGIVLCILAIAFAVTLTSYLKFQQKFNNLASLNGIIFLLVILGSLTCVALMHLIEHYTKGFPFKRFSRNEALNINTQNQSAILIHMPPKALPSIDCNSNILNLFTNYKIYNRQHTLNITYNAGLLNYKRRRYNNVQGVSLLTNEPSIEQVKQSPNASGILITLKSNTLHTQTEGKEILKYKTVLYQDRTLFLYISYIHSYNPEDYFEIHNDISLHNLLTSHIISSEHPNARVYDIVALKLLQAHSTHDIATSMASESETCPTTTINPEDHWLNTQNGQIALTFFSKFPYQKILNADDLAITLTKEQDRRLKHILEYIQNNNISPSHQINKKHIKGIIELIQDTHLRMSYDTNHYSCLWKNRMSTEGRLILEILEENIHKDKVFQCICAIASINKHNTHQTDSRTNTIISHMLLKVDSQINCIHILMNNVDKNTGLIYRDKLEVDNIHVLNMLHILFNKEDQCSIPELIKRAREHVSHFCAQYMRSYITRTISMDLDVDNITLLSPQEQEKSAEPSTNITTNRDNNQQRHLLTQQSA
ncbi:hypothetical protein EDL79_01535 [Ehrlichia ruminantium]|uniref:Uncharacterized protein n=1 Tax=Ehrlichia ruminantium TaxID=779 RepID=A0AAE6QAL1_EHRRU|nr:hypothetical protein [Ehrlichia ruminantium]QGR02359.1 hypothetical protein EDL81_01540 [Ehrlichia ruminantium]QGR03278.1 hypothetical protein EDL80_01535 [Ehrlichia ruminantium]QGR04203.1 hypothetical protein EDL79_01535 [Ehrlichia ruminantium]